LCGQFAPQSGRIDVVDEGALAVDLDDRQPFPILRLELQIAVDLDLAQVERNFPLNLGDNRASSLAEVAAASVVEDDLHPCGRRR
jgi:hypothetical protein